jgi:hypothetical protein
MHVCVGKSKQWYVCVHECVHVCMYHRHTSAHSCGMPTHSINTQITKHTHTHIHTQESLYMNQCTSQLQHATHTHTSAHEQTHTKESLYRRIPAVAASIPMSTCRSPVVTTAANFPPRQNASTLPICSIQAHENREFHARNDMRI